jgi:serine/threonine protein kinase
MQWDFAVDLWSVGILVRPFCFPFLFLGSIFQAPTSAQILTLPQAWDLVEPKGLFQIYDLDNPEINEAFHLAHMVRILGPPPLDFLRRSPKSQKYWDDAGDWKGVVPLPPPATLESLVTSLQGRSKDDFLDFIRGMLQWEPRKRTSTGHAWSHPWISESESEQASEATEE